MAEATYARKPKTSTHCTRGHLWSETAFISGKEPYRRCRECRNTQMRERPWIKSYLKKWKLNNKNRVKVYNSTPQALARQQLSRAIRKGDLIRTKICTECGDSAKPEGHHFDYSRPLEVIWLCRLCHVNTHNKLRRQK